MRSLIVLLVVGFAIFANANTIYVGCYPESPTRELSYKGPESISVTIAVCIDACVNAGYKYAGLQYSQQCWCGDVYGTIGSRNESLCNMPCAGNSGQMCGSGYVNSIYATGVKQPGYLGCYRDTAARDLPYLVTGGSPTTTISWCITSCRTAGYSYAGLQDGNQCFCGQSYGRQGGAITESSCSKTCTGNSTEYCGASWANSIYYTGIRVTAYKGCFNDQADRDLTYMQSTLSPTMSVGYCISSCRDLGYSYAGVQDHNQCFCGNSYGRYGGRADSDCSSDCTGNANEKCGNQWMNNVYATTYLGCFQDNSARDLVYPNNWFGSATVANCRSACGAIGYKYAGLQAANQCFCGNSFANFGPLREETCSTPCSGNSADKCGNSWTNSVYFANVVSVPTAPSGFSAWNGAALTSSNQLRFYFPGTGQWLSSGTLSIGYQPKGMLLAGSAETWVLNSISSWHGSAGFQGSLTDSSGTTYTGTYSGNFICNNCQGTWNHVVRATENGAPYVDLALNQPNIGDTWTPGIYIRPFNNQNLPQSDSGRHTEYFILYVA